MGELLLMLVLALIAAPMVFAYGRFIHELLPGEGPIHWVGVIAATAATLTLLMWMASGDSSPDPVWDRGLR